MPSEIKKLSLYKFFFKVTIKAAAYAIRNWILIKDVDTEWKIINVSHFTSYKK